MTKTTKKILIGVLSTAFVSAVVYLLVSPNESDTRKKIADNLGDWASSIGDYFSATKEEIPTV